MALTYTDAGNRNNVTETGTSTKTGNQSVSGTGSQTTAGTQTQNTNQTQVQNVSSMSGDALAALDGLINSLSGRMSRTAAINILNQNGVKAPTRPDPNIVVSSGVGGLSLRETPGYANMLAKYNEDMANYEAQIQQTMAGTGKSTNEGAILQQKNIDQEIATNRAGREGYSKENAIKDSNAFTDRAMREMLEKTMPSINAIIEGSGTSGGGVAGLLKNDAAARAAENAATLSVQAAVEYGKISNDASQILTGLVNQAPAATQLLLQALGVAKGSMQSGTTSTIGKNATETVGTQNTTENKNISSTDTINSKSVKAPTELEELLGGVAGKSSMGTGFSGTLSDAQVRDAMIEYRRTGTLPDYAIKNG